MPQKTALNTYILCYILRTIDYFSTSLIFLITSMVFLQKHFFQYNWFITHILLLFTPLLLIERLSIINTENSMYRDNIDYRDQKVFA